MAHVIRLGIVLATALAAAVLHAEPPPDSPDSNNKDWKIACDNTGTCRIAGYQASSSAKPVSVLFTRAAGENMPIMGEVYLHGAADIAHADLLIDGKAQGQVVLQPPSGKGKLSDSQTQQLLTAIKRGQNVAFKQQDALWTLSNAGANVALLHADEIQQREGTPTAFIHIGNEKKSVRAAEPQPVINVPPVSQDKAVVIKFASKGYKNVQGQLLAARQAAGAPERQDCPAADKQDITLYPLDKDNALLALVCTRGAQQDEDEFFITDGKGKQVKKYVGRFGNSGKGYHNGLLSVGSKGRAAGDCLALETYAWNGAEFVLAEAMDTGLCRGFAGGAWDFYHITSDIRRVE